MAFDLTILGSHEFLYESDQTYNVTYALDSEQNGNMVTFEVSDLPERIDATWGMDLGVLGDLSASSYLDLNMSRDVRRLALYFLGEERPFVELENFPRKLRLENTVDIPHGTGNITIRRGLDDVRVIDLTIAYDTMLVTKSFALKNNFMQLSWTIDLLNGTGLIDISRDSDSAITLTSVITLADWTFSKVVELRNTHLQLSWEINQAQRTGTIHFSRTAGGDPTITLAISHNTWAMQDTLELKNNDIELSWDLATETDPHAQTSVTTDGEEFFYNTLSVIDNTVPLLQFGIGLSTQDHFALSWDNNAGVISNFQWSGKILSLSSLDLSVNLPGDTLTLQGTWHIGESGLMSIEINKPVAITFVDVATPRFSMNGFVSFSANRRLDIGWSWGDTGYLRVTTNGHPLGDAASFTLLIDPSGQGNYQYGFHASTTQFLQTNFNITWDLQYPLPRIWIAGELPLNWWQNWDSSIYLDSQWYDRGGWIYL